MSKLNLAIRLLEINLKYLRDGQETRGKKEVKDQIKLAIAILESYPKWELLIEAAKKVDKKVVLDELNYIENVLEKVANYFNIDINSQIRSLLESIPEEEKNPDETEEERLRLHDEPGPKEKEK